MSTKPLHPKHIWGAGLRCAVVAAALFCWAASAVLGAPPAGSASAAPAGSAGTAATAEVATVAPPAAAGAGCAYEAPRVARAYREVVEAVPAPPGSTAGEQRRVTPADELQLGDVLTVDVPGLPAFLAQLAAPACKGKQLVLYLEDRPLPDLVAFPPTNPHNTTLRFTLLRTEKSRAVWTFLLGSPSWSPRPTQVSVGLADEYAFPSDAPPIKLTIIPQWRFIFWAILFTLLVAAFLGLAAHSDLLRDSAPTAGANARRPFSLARSQGAWWFFLILASYLFIGLITGDFNSTITGTVLVLLGISAGTVVGSAVMDAGQAKPTDQAVQAASANALTARVNQIQAAIEEATRAVAANPADAEVAARLQALTLDLQQRHSSLKKARNETEDFLSDILSDANGVSFHRFQNATWTVVLGIIFVSEVYRSLAMPTFDGSLLALMGISSGTYLGMKIPEAKVPSAT
ncbi:MAG TPA: hypothetical protein VHR45_05445 [Thermoanaerobaculia bacterium]|nr:hypothetical protein [Thermoanaerobaculia bacterium]